MTKKRMSTYLDPVDVELLNELSISLRVTKSQAVVTAIKYMVNARLGLDNPRIASIIAAASAKGSSNAVVEGRLASHIKEQEKINEAVEKRFSTIDKTIHQLQAEIDGYRRTPIKQVPDQKGNTSTENLSPKLRLEEEFRQKMTLLEEELAKVRSSIGLIRGDKSTPHTLAVTTPPKASNTPPAKATTVPQTVKKESTSKALPLPSTEMEKRGLSDGELAGLVGMKRTTVYDHRMRRRKNPTANTLNALDGWEVQDGRWYRKN